MSQTISQRMKRNGPSKAFIVVLATGLISGVNGLVSCTSSSPQCCWVTFLWQKFGKTVTTVNSAGCNYTIPGLTYSGPIVTKIDWNNQGLVNDIPTQISKLTSLTEL